MSFRNLKDDPNGYFDFVKEMINIIEYGSRASKLELIAEVVEAEQPELLEEIQDRMGIEEYYRTMPLC